MTGRRFSPRKTGMFMAVAALLLGCIDVAFAQTTITVGQGGGFDFNTIQAAIDAATIGDTVVVHPGVYFENIHFRGKDIILRSTDPTDTATVAATVINGHFGESVVTFAGTESDRAALLGLTIYNGESETDGGGILGGTPARATLARIEHNVITGNRAGRGGGIAHCAGDIRFNTISDNHASVPIGALGGGLYACGGAIQQNTISENRAAHEGGGAHSCSGTISGNEFIDNKATWIGGAMIGCSGLIQDNVVRGNRADTGSAMIHCHGTIRNNLITGNYSRYGPTHAGVLDSCNGFIVNNTLAENLEISEKGVAAVYRCQAEIRNCIFWGNARALTDEVLDSSPPVYSCIDGWTSGGVGNISDDPLFTTGPLGPCYLSQVGAGQARQSPCVDAGTGTVLQLGLADRTTRTDGVGDAGVVDVGFHFAVPPPPPPTRAKPWKLYR